MKLTIVPKEGEKFEVEVKDDGCVVDLKSIISKKMKIPSKIIRVFNSNKKIAKNTERLISIGAKDGGEIEILVLEKNEEFDPQKIFNAFIKKIEDKSGSDETMTEIIMLMEKPKVATLFEQLSSDPVLYRKILDRNPILAVNASLYDCVINTFTELGAPPIQRIPPVTTEQVIELFGIEKGDDFDQKMGLLEAKEAIATLKKAIEISGGYEKVKNLHSEPVFNKTLEEIFSSQIALLNGMGFCDNVKNLRALEETGGNVSLAVEWIMSH